MIQHLRHISTELAEMGYGIEELNPTALEPAMLRVVARDDGEPMEHVLTIGLFPDDASDGVLVQFYFEFPGLVDVSRLAEANAQILSTNRSIAVGAFNLSNDATGINYRYVLASPRAVGVPRDVMVDVMDMAIYAMETFGPTFAPFCGADPAR